MPTANPIKVAIAELGRTQREIAAEVGIDEFQLSRIVNRRRHASDDLKARLAQVLRRKVEDLFGEQEMKAAA